MALQSLSILCADTVLILELNVFNAVGSSPPVTQLVGCQDFVFNYNKISQDIFNSKQHVKTVIHR